MTRGPRMAFVLLGLGLGVAPVAAEESDSAPPAADPERGRSVYLTSCAACHHEDPSLKGGIGPPVSGASRELLVARLLHASYPEGYTPQRPSRIMPAMPHLAEEIDHLHAWLSGR